MKATQVRTLIERFTAHDEVPVLSPEDIGQLVTLSRAEQPWVAETVYRQGDYVTATGEDVDQRWVVLIAGTSGTVEPDWDTITDQTPDGSVRWGFGGAQTYDTYGAAAVGWEWKAARVANAYDFAREGQNWNRSQMFDHCREQAEYYRQRSTGLVTSATGATPGGQRVGTHTAQPPDQGFRVVDPWPVTEELDDLTG